MPESRGSRARGVDRLDRARVNSIGSAAREFHQLSWARLSSIGSTHGLGPAREQAWVGWRAWLGRLAGLDDGPMSPSPRVMNSI
jgi:hypothetical protein